jgi:hypothetical protein
MRLSLCCLLARGDQPPLSRAAVELAPLPPWPLTVETSPRWRWRPHLADGEIPASQASPLGCATNWWAPLTSGPRLSVPRCGVGVKQRVYPAFQQHFLKGFEKWIFRNYVNDLENHNLLNMTPKMMKLILVDFLGIDLQYKILHVKFVILLYMVLFNSCNCYFLRKCIINHRKLRKIWFQVC